ATLAPTNAMIIKLRNLFSNLKGALPITNRNSPSILSIRNCHRSDRTNFDATIRTETARRNLARPLNRFLDSFTIQNVVAGELFFRFSEWAIRRQRLAVTVRANSDGCRCRLKRLRAMKYSALFRLAHHGAMSQGDFFVLFRGRLSFA